MRRWFMRLGIIIVSVPMLAALLWLCGKAYSLMGTGGPQVKVENRTDFSVRVHGELVPPNFTGFYSRPGGWARRPSSLRGDVLPSHQTGTISVIVADRRPADQLVAVTAVTEAGEPVFQKIYSVGELNDPELMIVITDQRPLPPPPP